MPDERKPLTAAEELAREAPDEITEHDREPGNLNVRAGYLRGLAEVCVRPEDRLVLLRASRSLRAYAEDEWRARCGAVLTGDEGETYVCALHPAHATGPESDHTDAMGLAQWPVKLEGGGS